MNHPYMMSASYLNSLRQSQILRNQEAPLHVPLLRSRYAGSSIPMAPVASEAALAYRHLSRSFPYPILLPRDLDPSDLILQRRRVRMQTSYLNSRTAYAARQLADERYAATASSHSFRHSYMTNNNKSIAMEQQLVYQQAPSTTPSAVQQYESFIGNKGHANRVSKPSLEHCQRMENTNEITAKEQATVGRESSLTSLTKIQSVNMENKNSKKEQHSASQQSPVCTSKFQVSILPRTKSCENMKRTFKKPQTAYNIFFKHQYDEDMKFPAFVPLEKRDHIRSIAAKWGKLDAISRSMYELAASEKQELFRLTQSSAQMEKRVKNEDASPDTILSANGKERKCGYH